MIKCFTPVAVAVLALAVSAPAAPADPLKSRNSSPSR